MSNKVHINGDQDADDVVEVVNATGRGSVLLVCEHASNFIPDDLHDLGLDHDARHSHVAWDLGALDVARLMSQALEVALVASRVSRLVYDCNRPPHEPSAIPAQSEVYPIPGNAKLSDAQRHGRANKYYFPFQDRLTAVLDEQSVGGKMFGLVTIHSFTRHYHGVRRGVDIGILHDTDSHFADALLRGCLMQSGLKVCRNAPYGPRDGVTHTLKDHALGRGIANVMIEICNDLIVERTQQEKIAGLLTRAIREALFSMKSTHRQSFESNNKTNTA